MQPLSPASPRRTPEILASQAASSLLRQTRQPRDAHLRSQASVSADIAASLASPFAQPVSSSDMQILDVLKYSQRILRDQILRGRSRSPDRDPNRERVSDNQPMNAANFEYEESATENCRCALTTSNCCLTTFRSRMRPTACRSSSSENGSSGYEGSVGRSSSLW